MYNIKAIKAIPLADVARGKYGMNLEKKGNRLWGKLRDNEATASFSINLDKNLWYDFGSGKGGSVIDLVAQMEGISSTEAINLLAEYSGIKNEVAKGWQPLTDSQYRELGIEPERATMNFKFDLNIHSPELLRRWSEKYGMHVKELAEKFPDEYNKLLQRLSGDMINHLRNAYFTKIKLATDPSVKPENREVYKHWAELDASEINTKVDLFQRAYKGNSPDIKALRVDPVKDLNSYDLHHGAKDISDNNAAAIHSRIKKIYKVLGYPQAEYFSLGAAVSLNSLNYLINGTEDKYLSIQEVKDLYKLLGNALQKDISLREKLLKDSEGINIANDSQKQDWKARLDDVERSLLYNKELFGKSSSVIEGLREAALAYKSDIAKHSLVEKAQSREFGLSRD